MACSAGTPISKNRLLNIDVRYPILFQSMDDRNDSERRQGGVENSRNGLVNYYVSDDKRCFNRYNDRRYTINKKIKKILLKENKEKSLGMDKRLMNHFSYIMIRDNICIFKDDFDEEKINGSASLFECFNLTTWFNMRLKAPNSYDSEIGWLVEFRPLEAQITQEQNFLFGHIVVIFQRLVTCPQMRLNFYIPMSLVNFFSHIFRFMKTILEGSKQMLFSPRNFSLGQISSKTENQKLKS